MKLASPTSSNKFAKLPAKFVRYEEHEKRIPESPHDMGILLRAALKKFKKNISSNINLKYGSCRYVYAE